MTDLQGSLTGVDLPAVVRLVAGLPGRVCVHATQGPWTAHLVCHSGRVVGAAFGADRGLVAVEAMALALPGAHYAIARCDTPIETDVDLSADDLLHHLSRLAGPGEDVRRVLARLDDVPHLVAPDTLDQPGRQVVLERGTLATLVAIDGHRSVEEIAARRGLLQAGQDLAILLELGLVSLAPPASPARGAARTSSPNGAFSSPEGAFAPSASPGVPGGTAPSELASAPSVTPAGVGAHWASPPGGARGAPAPRREGVSSGDAVRAAPPAAVFSGSEPGGLFATLGRFAYRFRWAVLVAALVFVAGSAAYGLGVYGSVKTGGFVDPDTESSRAADLLSRELGWDEGTLVVLFTSRDGSTVQDEGYRREVEAVLRKVEGQPGVGQIFTYYNTGRDQFLGSDKRMTYAAVGLAGDDDTQVRRVRELTPLLTSDHLDVRLGGRPAVYAELDEQVEADLHKAELLTFPIVGLLLVVIFGSAVASALPLVIGGTAILGAFLVLRFVAGYTDISVFALNIITMLGFGLAIDYSLFVVSRFREELARHDGAVRAALLETMRTAGHTVLFSGLTVVASLLSLLVFAPMFLRSMGFGAATAVLIAMVAALTILPAVLAILGRRVNALSVWSIFPARRRPAPGPAAAPHGAWYRISELVMRHPGKVLVGTLLPLLIVGLPFLHINFTVLDPRSLPASHESREVHDVMADVFPPNETQPIQLVVRSSSPALDSISLAALYDYTRQVAKLDGVRRVDSLVNLDPRLDKEGYIRLYSPAGRAQAPQLQPVIDRLSRDRYTVVSVLYDGEPYAEANRELVREIRAIEPPPGLKVTVGGEPAYLVDFLQSLASDVPLAFGLIVTVMFVILFAMLGSLVVPVKAVVLNLLSLSVSFGALVWIFQDGHLAGPLHFTPLGSVDAAQPVLMFAGAFGLSMDYQVFLLSRIKEQYDRTGDVRASVALGIQKTGAIITSAAVLLAVVIGGFATGEVLFIKQIGVGLALAILVDATIVRSLLVPATMRLMGKYNWWAPAPLKALHERLGLGEPPEPPDPAGDAPGPDAPAMAQPVLPRVPVPA